MPDNTFKMEAVCTYSAGIVGGMGSYATVHLFNKIIDRFPVEKEWQRPRIIIDNNCIMPSRVRAILYDERRPELVKALADSITKLLEYDVNQIVLACNTSHYFLPEIRELVAIPDGVLVDIIDSTARLCYQSGCKSIYVIATEGTIATRLYDNYCANYNIQVDYPGVEEQVLLREFIEGVKQNNWEGLIDQFSHFIQSKNNQTVILGCTELSVIWDGLKIAKPHLAANVLDPLDLAVESIHSAAQGFYITK